MYAQTQLRTIHTRQLPFKSSSSLVQTTVPPKGQISTSQVHRISGQSHTNIIKAHTKDKNIWISYQHLHKYFTNNPTHISFNQQHTLKLQSGPLQILNLCAWTRQLITMDFDRKQDVNTGMCAGWINIIFIHIFHIYCSQIHLCSLGITHLAGALVMTHEGC